jgi:hypothetical protein
MVVATTDLDIEGKLDGFITKGTKMIRKAFRLLDSVTLAICWTSVKKGLFDGFSEFAWKRAEEVGRECGCSEKTFDAIR